MRFSATALWILCAFAFSAVGNDAIYHAPIRNDPDHQHFLYGIPAPRGVITDREGKPLAVSRSAQRFTVNLTEFVAENGEENLEEKVVSLVEGIAEMMDRVLVPTEEEVASHWRHRPLFPMALSEPLSESNEAEADFLVEFYGAGLELQDTYLRTYPAGRVASHIVGYVGRSAPDQHGPIVNKEPLWPRFEGRYGLEETLDGVLSGEPGVLSVVYDMEGKEVFRQIVQAPVPGLTVVSSLSLSMQEVAHDALRSTKHRGAIVLLDSQSGDVLASVSNPSFDASIFVPSISESDFREVADAEGSPLFNRAVSATYPPGSTFKPIVALAGLRSARIQQYDRFSGPSSMWIDGLEFRNWSKYHEGSLDVRYALLRSCNTWFYQAAFQIKDEPILTLSHELGLGVVADIPLTGVARGNLPEKAPSRRGLANLSIGQGAVLASPLQMAEAMTVFATKGTVVRPKLLRQLQHPESQQIVKVFTAKTSNLQISERHVETIRDGMWGVVHHSRGTAGSADAKKVTVYGKTGTSQWMSEGREQRVAWFTGFIDADNPQISFAVLTEGGPGESMSGGRNSAPVIASVLNTVYADANRFLVSVPDSSRNSRPRISEPKRAVAASAPARPTVQEVRRPVPQKRKGFFARLFGGGGR